VGDVVCRFFVFAMLVAGIYGCQGRQMPFSTPGTLYVQFEAPHGSLAEITEIRDGHVVGHRATGFVVARDRPDRSFAAAAVPVCDWSHSIGTYKLSPDASWALCSSESDSLWLFDPTHPRTQRVLLTQFRQNANDTSFAWLDDNRFAAVVFDMSCPAPHLHDFFAAREMTFDRSGRSLSKGPCALGVVAGRHRIALLGERRNNLVWRIHQFVADDPDYYNDGYDRFHPTWSVDDGKTWHDGLPLAFDGNDVLLYAEQFSDAVRSEDGRLVFKNALDIQWSR
jgi:hypothetical protein